MTAATAAVDQVQLPFLPKALREPRRPLLTISLACLLSIGGSLLVATIIRLAVPEASGLDFGWLMGRGWFAVFVLAVFAPLIETLILVATTGLLLMWIKPHHAVLLSSFGWALAHSYQAPVSGLVIWWPFIIFTTLFVVWKERSLVAGLAMPFIVHAFQNLLPAIAIGFPGLLPA